MLSHAANDVSPDDCPNIVEVALAPLLERDGSHGASLEGGRRDGVLAAIEILPRLLARCATKVEVLRPDKSRLVHDLDGMNGQAYFDHAVDQVFVLAFCV